jgi:hypothetical protein
MRILELLDIHNSSTANSVIPTINILMIQCIRLAAKGAFRRMLLMPPCGIGYVNVEMAQNVRKGIVAAQNDFSQQRHIAEMLQMQC